ncbi:hypothetical protein DFH27DRAFT_72024 [Peziza echinospora]|nr:hypothetical protein DFH27DRAFT_72024 [Peziza echinospora]
MKQAISLSAALLTTVFLVLTTGASAQSGRDCAQSSSQCVAACCKGNDHTTTCDPKSRESVYEMCICDRLGQLKPLVECINKCNMQDIKNYADTVPDQCERSLFPSVPNDSDDDNDDDDDDDFGGDNAGLVQVTGTMTGTGTASATATGSANMTATRTGTATGTMGNSPTQTGNNSGGDNGSAGVGAADMRRDGIVALAGLTALTIFGAMML